MGKRSKMINVSCKLQVRSRSMIPGPVDERVSIQKSAIIQAGIRQQAKSDKHNTK